MRDVVLGHPERALEDQGLEHGGVEPPVGLGLAGQGAVGDREVLQVERDGFSARRTVPDAQRVPRLSRPVAPDRGRERRFLVGREVVDQPVGGERR